MTQYSGKIIRKNPVTPTQQSASGVWTTADAAAATKNNNWPVAGVPNPISRSVRLRASASAYVTRTFGNPTNNLKWTYSVWFKKGVMNAGALFSNAGAGNGSVSNTFQYLLLDFNGSQGGQLEWRQVNSVGTITAERQPTMLLRDPSAWYHLVCVWDSANATAGNRMLMYLNGVQITSFTASVDPSSSLQSYINSNGYIHDIGATFLGGSRGSFFDGYLTEINFIDGQALTPSSFGTTDPLSGAWIPMPYTGTYGANGFYLNFKDNTSTTTIGYDYSGNSNNWTANNISLTAGATYDSMVDVPTLWMPYNTAGDTGALVRGNYAVLNPVAYGSVTNRTSTSNGNLSFSDATSTNTSVIGTIAPTSGKWYFELTSSNTGVYAVGLFDSITKTGSFYRNNGAYSSSFGGGGTTGYSSWTTGDVIGVAWDADAGKIWYAKNNTWQSGSPSAGTSPTNTFTANTGLTCSIETDNSAGTKSGDFNFGQRPFTYTPPTGFKTLNTFNLPAPTINNGALYMAATLYTGNGSTQSLTNTVNGISFQPDLVWVKARSLAYSNYLYDSVRGTGTSKSLISDATAAEGAGSANANLTSFDASGFSLGTTSGVNGMNANAGTFVGWQWNAGGSTVTNTSGSISSQVRANTTSGFSVVTYTGTGSAATVGHGLGVAPSMIIVKSRNTAATNWVTYHTSFGATKYILLNTTGAVVTDSTPWNNTAPTSSVLSLGTSSNTNGSTATFVAYCFAAVAGYSAFGSYTGNGSTDGPFVFLGFRPRFVMIKNITNAQPWIIIDTARNTFNVAGDYLSPDSSGAENYASSRTTATNDDILSNGFKLRNDASSSGYTNASANTYIYAAFAENPFKYSNAR